MAAVGAYELNRRKFDWVRGSQYADRNLLAGTLAAATGLIISGALHETMPFLAIIPALSAILQANDGHRTKHRALLHISVLLVGISIGVWFYVDGIIGSVLLDRVATLP
ncbi:MAG: hypothetical protein IIC62_00645 [Proteobacteria bacterium]|nr:hypothetical protein [Pseudomonadota bacterium]